MTTTKQTFTNQPMIDTPGAVQTPTTKRVVSPSQRRAEIVIECNNEWCNCVMNGRPALSIFIHGCVHYTCESNLKIGSPPRAQSTQRFRKGKHQMYLCVFLACRLPLRRASIFILRCAQRAWLADLKMVNGEWLTVNC